MQLIRLPLLATIICSLVLGAPLTRAQAEPAGDQIELAEQPDLTAYPRVALFARVLDEASRPIANVTAAAWQVEEDGRSINDVVIEPTSLGLQVAFIVDAGAQPDRAGETGQATLEEARAAIRLFANDYMQPGDSAAVWAMADTRPIAVQPPTGAASELVAALDVFALRATPTITPAIEAALDSFAASATSTLRQRLIVVLSPGWRDRPDPALIQRLDAAGVNVNGILTRRGLDLNTGLSALVARAARPGLFVHYTGPQSVRSLYGAWNDGRDGYRLTYTSPTAAPGEHQVGVRLAGDEDAAATLAYLAPVPAGPQIRFTSHQPGFQVGRLNSELIGVDVTNPPGEPEIDRAELFVNDVSLGALEGSGPYAWAWDPAPYGERLAAEGESAGPVELRVQVTDATGQTTTTAIRGQALFAAIDACTTYRGVPAIGKSLYALCRVSGLTPPLVV